MFLSHTPHFLWEGPPPRNPCGAAVKELPQLGPGRSSPGDVEVEREIPAGLALLSLIEEMQTWELLAVVILPCGLENRDRWFGPRRKN